MVTNAYESLSVPSSSANFPSWIDGFPGSRAAARLAAIRDAYSAATPPHPLPAPRGNPISSPGLGKPASCASPPTRRPLVRRDRRREGPAGPRGLPGHGGLRERDHTGLRRRRPLQRPRLPGLRARQARAGGWTPQAAPAAPEGAPLEPRARGLERHLPARSCARRASPLGKELLDLLRAEHLLGLRPSLVALLAKVLVAGVPLQLVRLVCHALLAAAEQPPGAFGASRAAWWACDPREWRSTAVRSS